MLNMLVMTRMTCGNGESTEKSDNAEVGIHKLAYRRTGHTQAGIQKNWLHRS
jgi:hypothetical protein